MRKYLILCIQMLLTTAFAKAQNEGSLTVETCYKLARQNYPLIKQLELIDKSTGYTVNNVSKTYLPQVTINGQASYQSAVTEIPIKIPGNNIPAISKDQYKLSADVSQTIYDGGIIRLRQQAAKADGEVEKQKVEIELYKLKDRINQVFFSILILDEQLKQNDLLVADIRIGLTKAENMIANGTALKSVANVLKADMLKAGQHTIELKAAKQGYLEMLGLFINQSLNDNTVLIKPLFQTKTQEINRPELSMYSSQYKGLDVQAKMIRAQHQPKFSLFLQAGAGRPALNFLDNHIKPFYMGGLRLSWPVTGFYTTKNEKAQIGISKRSIDIQKETFLLNTRLQIKQQNAEIEKFEQLLSGDDDIIELRTSIKNTTLAQMENGAATGSDYLREVNAEDQAKQNMLLHEIQLLMSQYNNQITTGN